MRAADKKSTARRVFQMGLLVLQLDKQGLDALGIH
tara:strand:- start:5 stop:109 length:105 start_codon:yes stop_codon:yes gene_type:complete